ncbi:MAG: hypothetical protein ASARMPRED_002594 [Alectoria sarmentosa]|nr:MAG: hypothetical protein ASARMPRED_002594 [Alectoria sarmentosa]
MATEKSFRKSQLIAFDNVAAGHDGVLSDPSGELVIKPCKQSEIDFYDSTSAHPDLIAHIPTFFGKISLGADTNPAHAAGALILPSETDPEPSVIHGVPDTMIVENAWAPSNGGRIHTDSAVVLENVAAGFKKPNILDVKLGARLWADDAPMAKRVRLDKIAEETTSKPLNLRIEGMKTYRAALINGETRDGYRFYDKTYGRNFTVETIAHGFEEYFQLTKGAKAKGAVRKVIRRFIEDLRAVESVIEKEESRMYSASLLFVYEGDQQALQDAFETERNIINSLDRKVSDGEDLTSGNGATNGDDLIKGNGTANGNGTDADVHVDDDDDEKEEGEEKSEEIKFPAIQSLKLIDFAHAEWTPGQGPDENILHGIRNTTKILTSLTG